MRLRNVKGKQEILNNHPLIILNPEIYKGKWQELFRNNYPIYIEIGMGKGQFIIQQALRNKHINYIGVEKYDSVIVRALKKINIYIPNLKLIRADAFSIDQIFNKEISLIYLNFSDPWPKKRHANRRLTSKEFLLKYNCIFKSSYQIKLRTDNEELFTYSLITLTNHNYKFKEITLDLTKNREKDHISTEYEDKFVEAGYKVYALSAYRDN
ncbi:MAG: tRNA (guanosine(46)-N7)-methyltransferase TrmB [Tenericutes bacterium]|nr:tRNA (guanosine(46)-N7)-methyltransferase TrmB [Mycoplasmatota bacterium]